jgi:hypothetical protein
MSLVRLLPASLHAVADYAVGALLIIVAVAVGGSAGAVGTGIVVGATVLVVSLITNYQYSPNRTWNAAPQTA